MEWPQAPDVLQRAQEDLAARAAPPWRPGSVVRCGGCFVCFERGGRGVGAAGDRGWAAASLVDDGEPAIGAVEGTAGGAYRPGLLALREGPLLAAAFAALPARPDVLLVDATGRDHPRRAGLALHLGAVLDVPTVGVTHRCLLATGRWPELIRGCTSPLMLDGEAVGHWLCTRSGARPLAVHAAWRTDPDTAVEVVLGCTRRFRTPEPLRVARRAARRARAGATGR